MVRLTWFCDRCGREAVHEPPDPDWLKRPHGWEYHPWVSDLSGHRRLLCRECVSEICGVIDTKPKARTGPGEDPIEHEE